MQKPRIAIYSYIHLYHTFSHHEFSFVKFYINILLQVAIVSAFPNKYVSKISMFYSLARNLCKLISIQHENLDVNLIYASLDFNCANRSLVNLHLVFWSFVTHG